LFICSLMRNAKWVLAACLLLLAVQANAQDSTLIPPEGWNPVPTEEQVINTVTENNESYYCLLIQDVTPWDYNSNVVALQEAGIPLDVINSSSLNSVDLGKYSFLMYASDQYSSYYSNISANIGKIEAFVDAGGLLIAHVCDMGWHGGNWSGYRILPGGTAHSFTYSQDLEIVDHAHPVIRGTGGTYDIYANNPNYFDGWTYSTHGVFTSLTATATKLVNVQSSSNSTYISYTYGSGEVLATLQTVEWGYRRSGPELLRNELRYAKSFGPTPAPTYDVTLQIPAYSSGYALDNGANNTNEIVSTVSVNNSSGQVLSDVRLTCEIDGANATADVQGLTNGTISQLMTGTTEFDAIITFVNYVNENFTLRWSITSIEGYSTNVSASKTLSFLFTENSNGGPFLFSADTYPFRNFRIDWDAVWKTWNVVPNAYILALLSQYGGSCFGMAATAGEYLVDPSKKPIDVPTSQLQKDDPGVRENIIDYHFSQILQNTDTDNQPVESAEVLEILRLNEPVILGYRGKTSQGKRFGHAVLCPRVVIDHDEDVTFYGLYDNNDIGTQATYYDWARYSSGQDLFTRSGCNDCSFFALRPYLPLSIYQIRLLVQDWFAAELENLKSRLEDAFSLGSPALMLVVGNSGDSMGYRPDGSFVDQITDGRIEASFFGEDLSGTIFVPSATEISTIELFAVDSGSIHFSMIQPNGAWGDGVFVVNFPTVTADFRCRIYPQSQQVDVDYDGDGNIDESRDFIQWISMTSGTLCGSVISSESGLLGVTVGLYDGSGTLLNTSVSDELGAFDFGLLPNGDYFVSVIPPLGYSVQDEIADVTLEGARVCVDFALTKAVIEAVARGRGYWMHQVNTLLSGKGNPHESYESMCEYMELIRTHFNDHGLNPINVFQVPLSDDCDQRLEALRVTISPKANATMNEKARAHLTGLLLNMVSGKIAQWQSISEDSLTVSQAITYCNDLITDGDDDNDELAKGIAEMINEGETVPAGLIDSFTPDIAYKQGSEPSLPTEYTLSQNYPNPFNPVTEISFSLPQATEVKLDVFNLLGQNVTTIYEGTLEAGTHSFSWDGPSVASGVYLYRLTAGDFVTTKKMILLK